MDVIPTLGQVIDQTTTIVNGVDPSQLDNPSPCTEWPVRGVLNHIIGGSKMLTTCVRDGDISDEALTEIFTSDNLGSDFKAAWASASDGAMVAFGEADLAKVVKSPLGETPVAALATYLVFDVMTHAADIARATGQTIADDDLVLTALEVGRQVLGSGGRDPERFDAEQVAPDGASPQVRLLAFAGRRV